jgi:hypothetical protein
MRRIVAVEHLKKGDVVDLWDLGHGVDSTVKSVEVKDRPGYRYRNVFVTMANDSKLLFLEKTKVEVFRT